MAKANSFKSEPWTQLERGSYSIFDDDFISDKLTFKFGKKSAASTVAFKESFQISKEGRIGKSEEELKFWFPVRNTDTLYFRLKNDSYKIHYDNGVQENNGYKFNFYASAQGKRTFNGDSLKIGLQTRRDDWSTNVRIAFKPVDLGATIYNKTYFTQNKWSFGFVNAFQAIANSWIFSAFQVGWQDNNGNDLYVRANAGKKYDKINPVHYLQDITVNYIYKYNANNNLGVEVKGNLATRDINNTSFVWDHKCESTADTAVKLKADTNRNFAASIKNAIPGYGNYLFGVNIHDFGGANRFTYGLQLDLNL